MNYIISFKNLILTVVLLIFTVPGSSAEKSIALGYEPKYDTGFVHFDYVDPTSTKKGTIRLSAFGTFESLNPFLLKSLAPAGLNDLVFETLMERSLDEPSSSYGHIASGYNLANDGLSVTYYIKDNATFSNGDTITSSDVLFSYNTLIVSP